MKVSAPLAMLALVGLGIVFMTGVVWWLLLGWNLLRLVLGRKPAQVARGRQRTRPELRTDS